MDAGLPRRDALAMIPPGLSRPWLLSVLLSALGAQEPARIALPHDTGTLAALPGWTALGRDELRAPGRASDPAEAPARSMLADAVAALRERGREAESLLLHAPGTAPGQLRLVNAHSAAARIAATDLADGESVATLAKSYRATLDRPGVTVEDAGGGPAALWDPPGVAVHFRLAGEASRWHAALYAVPAGDRVQYFETTWSDGDVDGRGELETLLRTFDGARQRSGGWNNGLLVGAVAGGVAGMVAALLRRRRQQRHFENAAGSATDPR